MGKLQTLVFFIIIHPLNLELGRHLARVANCNFFLFLFAYEKAFEVDECLVDCDKRVLADCADFEGAQDLLVRCYVSKFCGYQGH